MMKKRKMKRNSFLNHKTCLLILLLILTFSCKSMIEQVVQETNQSEMIRVKLVLDPVIEIPLNSSLIMEDPLSHEVIRVKPGQKILKIDLKNKQVLEGGDLPFPLIMTSRNDRLITINQQNFFGIIKIMDTGDQLEVINSIPLETYLMSVIPSEVPVSFEKEAIKAQAVVARTYAYLFMKKNGKVKDFDVDNTVRYQVYKGFNPKLKSSLVYKIRDAIVETEGLIVTYDQEPILAYFHSNSGGLVRSGKDYFGSHSDLPYLIQHDDPYSIDYPGGQWEYTMDIDQFKNLFDLTGDLTADQFVKNNNGFVEELVVEDYAYHVKDIRRTVGYAKVKSERFNIELDMDQKSLKFKGIGYGHGVGLSQWGAQGMAKLGYNFKEIISFYYPNTQIKWLIYEN